MDLTLTANGASLGITHMKCNLLATVGFGWPMPSKSFTILEPILGPTIYPIVKMQPTNIIKASNVQA